MKKYAQYLVVCLALLGSTKLYARPDFLQAWKNMYPMSSSSDRGCQLCHAKSDGGEPWNTYGFEIRFNYIHLYASDDIESSIRDVEPNNSDNDTENLSNITEINLNLDPGWAPGFVNSHIFKNGDVIRNQPPPFLERPDEGICFPVKSEGIGYSLICL